MLLQMSNLALMLYLDQTDSGISAAAAAGHCIAMVSAIDAHTNTAVI